ncbi:polyadenylate-binding protein 4-like [Oppia nitens]|uniref:polyadenylate-binding protein 4-like n=1 Tax=Oppia nitens TaxID=1686743 RepID=UPI0023DB61D1|nr:polyadenylate-binding protein 4-like [Oppia nitens]
MNGHSDNRSVFVTDLQPTVTETILLNTFAVCGAIRSVRVCRDSSGQSLGYGYVNFHSAEAAKQAIDEMNFCEVNGKPIQVMVVQSTQAMRSSSNANVFVKNLDKSVDTKRLYETFRPFGEIVSSKLAQEVSGVSKGFGFVQFKTEENAIIAIVAMNGKYLNGKQLFCSKFMPKSERYRHLAAKNTNGNSLAANNGQQELVNIYVRNLSQEFTDDLLEKFFKRFGRVICAKVFHKQFISFGFVVLENSVVADIAIKEMNGKTLPNGNRLFVSRAIKITKESTRKPTVKQWIRSNGKCFDGRDVYVKYLDNLLTDQRLQEMFSSFGEIKTVKTMGSGYGFVCFSSPEAAQRAIQNINNHYVYNKAILVESLDTRNSLLKIKSYPIMTTGFGRKLAKNGM